ncbi:hypothetical protein AAC387_Pa02g2882 [Persea americana]
MRLWCWEDLGLGVLVVLQTLDVEVEWQRKLSMIWILVFKGEFLVRRPCFIRQGSLAHPGETFEIGDQTSLTKHQSWDNTVSISHASPARRWPGIGSHWGGFCVFDVYELSLELYFGPTIKLSDPVPIDRWHHPALHADHKWVGFAHGGWDQKAPPSPSGPMLDLFRTSDPLATNAELGEALRWPTQAHLY